MFTSNCTESNISPSIPGPPLGPSRGRVGEVLVFQSSSYDPDGDFLSYEFDWGDGTTSSCSNFFPSGYLISLTHRYCPTGTYNIKARAMDIHDNMSEWSENTSVQIFSDTLSDSISFFVDGTRVATLQFSPDSFTTKYSLCTRGKSYGGDVNGLADNIKLNFWGLNCSNPINESFEGDLSSWNTFGPRVPKIIDGGNPGKCLLTNGDFYEESGILSNEIFDWGNTDWTVKFDGRVFSYSYIDYVECGIMKGESLIIGLRYGTGKVEMWTDLSGSSIDINMGEYPGIWRRFRIERE